MSPLSRRHTPPNPHRDPPIPPPTNQSSSPSSSIRSHQRTPPPRSRASSSLFDPAGQYHRAPSLFFSLRSPSLCSSPVTPPYRNHRRHGSSPEWSSFLDAELSKPYHQGPPPRPVNPRPSASEPTSSASASRPNHSKLQAPLPVHPASIPAPRMEPPPSDPRQRPVPGRLHLDPPHPRRRETPAPGPPRLHPLLLGRVQRASFRPRLPPPTLAKPSAPFAACPASSTELGQCPK